MSFFKNLFKGIIADKPKDNSGNDSSKGSATPYYGTVRPDPNFNASRDAAALQKAIETKGVDENAITEILARRTNAQRQEIKAAFQQDTGKELVKTLNSVLKSHYKHVVLALLMTPAQYNAHEIRQAMKGLGTKEKVLNEILGTRSNQEISLLKTAFKDEYGEELEHDIQGDTQGNFQKALLALCKGNDSSKGSATPYYGTVRPDPNFNASRDAVALQKAIETKGVDENAITEILARRTNAQRQEIKAAFQQDTGKELVKTLNSVLKSHYKHVVLALLMTPAQYNAHEIRQAMKGLGTKEKVLNEILGTRSNQEISLLKTAFKDEYGEELEHDIQGDTQGNFQKALLALCKGTRTEDSDIDDGLAKSTAKSLFEAGEERLGTVSSVFIDVLTSRGDAQLCKIFKQYEKFGTQGFAQAVKHELSGDTEDCLMTLVKAAWNKPAYFAERMQLAMKGIGADHNTVTRIIVSRSEVDLQKVLQEYKRMYGKTLQQDILAETKGDHEKILLVLCGDQTGV
ncbi:hypothetical protein PDJAM_G00165270 [Pangasius djambal]|uniref:Uncharacterized protein n=1 Tax=Pangasius djambal TaxID=1691987 RepID=A0ACC5ZLU6_9TELE|nr:hypothetical protein [Pangasius djambal]